MSPAWRDHRVPSLLGRRTERLETHPGQVRAAKAVGVAYLPCVFVLRLHAVVAELASLVYSEAVTADPCANPDCGNNRPTTFASELCISCHARTKRDAEELEFEVARVLRLESEFVVWCREHGHPHPHE